MSDLKRVYVVEVMVGDDPGLCQDHDAPVRWVSTGSYSTESEALDHARDPAETRDTRVRQFWVESGPPMTVAGVPSKAPMVSGEDLTDFRCDQCNTTAKGYEGGTPPRCQSCSREMLPDSMAADIQAGNIKVLT